MERFYKESEKARLKEKKRGEKILIIKRRGN